MKINVEIEMTPEEAKTMLNLPDFSGIVEKEIRDKINGWPPASLWSTNPLDFLVPKEKT
jgi:hypothetical protein